MTGATVPTDQLFYGSKFWSIGLDDRADRIGATFLVNHPDHILPRGQPGKVWIGLGGTVVQLVAKGIATRIKNGYTPIIDAPNGRILCELDIVGGAGATVGAVLL